jgi:hypothetical protein
VVGYLRPSNVKGGVMMNPGPIHLLSDNKTNGIWNLTFNFTIIVATEREVDISVTAMNDAPESKNWHLSDLKFNGERKVVQQSDMEMLPRNRATGPGGSMVTPANR